MDALDSQILIELMTDAGTPFSKIAKKIGVSRETVRKRFDKMNKNGTIIHSSILIDGHKLGEQGSSFFMVTCVRGSDKKAIFQNLQRIRDVCLVAELMGDFDFFVWVRLRDIQHLATIVNEIRKFKEIDQVETLLLPQTYFSFSLMPKVMVKCDGTDLQK